MKPIHLDPQQRQDLQRRRHETHDKRIFERLSAVLWVADGTTRCEVADLLGRSVRQIAEWLRLCPSAKDFRTANASGRREPPRASSAA